MGTHCLFQDIYVPGLFNFFCGGLTILCVGAMFCLFQDISVPRLLYFFCGSLSLFCVGALFCLIQDIDIRELLYFFCAVFASKGYPFKNIFDFTTAGDCVSAVEHLPVLQYSVDFIFLSFGIMSFIEEL